MADQKVQLVDSSGSPERVALDLLRVVHGVYEDAKPKSKKDVLNLYVDCLCAVRGTRPD
jgi:hypothetical protein